MKRFLFNGHNRQWYNFVAAENGETDLYIYDEISWWGVTAEFFVRDLKQITTPVINIHLNTPGGDVFDGVAIMNALRSHPSTVIAYVDGYAASIGSVIMMGADKVIAAPSSFVMIHNPWACACGESKDFRHMADTLDNIKNTIIEEYVHKTDKTAEDFVEMMDAETWMNGEQALEVGLVDEILEREPSSVDNKIDLSMFNNVPKEVLDKIEKPKPAEPKKQEAPVVEVVNGPADHKVETDGKVIRVVFDKQESEPAPTDDDGDEQIDEIDQFNAALARNRKLALLEMDF